MVEMSRPAEVCGHGHCGGRSSVPLFRSRDARLLLIRLSDFMFAVVQEVVVAIDILVKFEVQVSWAEF